MANDELSDEELGTPAERSFAIWLRIRLRLAGVEPRHVYGLQPDGSMGASNLLRVDRGGKPYMLAVLEDDDSAVETADPTAGHTVGMCPGWGSADGKHQPIVIGLTGIGHVVRCQCCDATGSLPLDSVEWD